MTDIRRADPALRRNVVLALVCAAVAGSLLLAAFERYDAALRGWLLSEPGEFAQRVELVFVILAVALCAPLLVLAACLWSFGGKIVRAGAYPPPGMRVVRDTPVVTGARAAARGRWFKVFALGCGIAAAALGWLLWRLTSLLSG